VITLAEGKGFGELALITDKVRAATCYCKSSELVLGTLDKSDYNAIIGNTFKAKMEQLVAYLNQVQLFESLSRKTKLNLFYYFHEKTFKRSHRVFSEGDKVDGIYVIIEGTCEKLKKSPLGESVISLLNEVEIVGTEDLGKKGAVRSFSLRAESDQVKLLFMSSRDFKERVLKYHFDIRKQLEGFKSD